MTTKAAAKATNPSTDGSLPVKVTVDGPDTKVARQVSEATALAVIRLIMGSTGIKESQDEAIYDLSGNDETEEGKLSVGEYLTGQNAQSSAEKITAIGWYLTRGKSNASFSQEDIVTQLDIARETKPKNLSRDIKETVRKNWLTVSTKGGYVVTRTGEEAVKGKFGRSELKPSAPKARRRKKTSKVTKAKRATSAK